MRLCATILAMLFLLVGCGTITTPADSIDPSEETQAISESALSNDLEQIQADYKKSVASEYGDKLRLGIADATMYAYNIGFTVHSLFIHCAPEDAYEDLTEWCDSFTEARDAAIIIANNKSYNFEERTVARYASEVYGGLVKLEKIAFMAKKALEMDAKGISGEARIATYGSGDEKVKEYSVYAEEYNNLLKLINDYLQKLGLYFE